MADEQRANDDKRFALAICEPLATREVHAILRTAEPTPEELSFLQAQHDLCDVRSALLSDAVRGDESIAGTINAALEPVKAVLERNGIAAASPALDVKLGQPDRSRFSWSGAGNHSKIWTINLIAQRWAADHQLASRAAFVESFGAQLRAAVPERAAEYTDAWLLTGEDERYLDSRLLNLDGTSYGVHWRCGFRNAQIGTGVHKPIIEFFRDTHGYPVAAL